jgi:hypothetical protein
MVFLPFGLKDVLYFCECVIVSCAGGYHPFYDIATALASAGNVVLTYDKRECAFIPGICAYVACGATHPPGSGCVQFSRYSLNDLASDAQAAIEFALTTYSSLLIPNKVTVMGHSQGCAVAPMGTTVQRFLSQASSFASLFVLVWPVSGCCDALSCEHRRASDGRGTACLHHFRCFPLVSF